MGNIVAVHYRLFEGEEPAVAESLAGNPHELGGEILLHLEGGEQLFVSWENEPVQHSVAVKARSFFDTPTAAPRRANNLGSLDKVFTFDDPYACRMSQPMRAIFDGLVRVDKSTYDVSQGAGIQLPGSAVAVVPTFSRNRESGQGYDAAEVLATLPVSATWMGLRVSEIQYAFFEQSSNYEYRILFEHSASQALETLNAHGFRLQGVGVPNLFHPKGDASYGVVLKKVGTRSELSCGSRMFY
jgi:hypothetical protein